MARFYALQVIMKKVKFNDIPSKYKDEAMAIIEEKRFTINK